MSHVGGYRTPDGPLTVAVVYRVVPPAYAAVMFGLLAIVAFVTVALSHRVELLCERSHAEQGECSWTDSGPFGMSARDAVPLQRVSGAELAGDPSYVRLTLHRVPGGSYGEPLAKKRESWLEGDKRRMVDAINAFVRDESRPRLAVGYGSRWWNAWPVLAVEVGLAVVLGSWARRRVRVLVDRAVGEVVFEQPRLFRGPRVRSRRLSTIEGVALEPAGRGHRLVLVCEGGARERLGIAFHPFGDVEPVCATMDSAIRDARAAACAPFSWRA